MRHYNNHDLYEQNKPLTLKASTICFKLNDNRIKTMEDIASLEPILKLVKIESHLVDNGDIFSDDLYWFLDYMISNNIDSESIKIRAISNLNFKSEMIKKYTTSTLNLLDKLLCQIEVSTHTNKIHNLYNYLIDMNKWALRSRFYKNVRRKGKFLDSAKLLG